MAQENEVNLDDLLAEQAKIRHLGTIEAVPDKNDVVKITPWLPGRGCSCANSLVVEKLQIKRLVDTGQVHPCCGHSLKVMEIEFVDGSTMPLATVFDEFARRAPLAGRNLQPRYFAGRTAGSRPVRVRTVDHTLPVVIDPTYPDPWGGGDGGDDGSGGYGAGNYPHDGGSGSGGDGDGTGQMALCIDDCMADPQNRKNYPIPGQRWRWCSLMCADMG